MFFVGLQGLQYIPSMKYRPCLFLTHGFFYYNLLKILAMVKSHIFKKLAIAYCIEEFIINDTI